MTKARWRAATAARLPFDDSPQYLCRSQKMRLPCSARRFLVGATPCLGALPLMTLSLSCGSQRRAMQNAVNAKRTRVRIFISDLLWPTAWNPQRACVRRKVWFSTAFFYRLKRKTKAVTTSIVVTSRIMPVLFRLPFRLPSLTFRRPFFPLPEVVASSPLESRQAPRFLRTRYSRV